MDLKKTILDEARVTEINDLSDNGQELNEEIHMLKKLCSDVNHYSIIRSQTLIPDRLDSIRSHFEKRQLQRMIVFQFLSHQAYSFLFDIFSREDTPDDLLESILNFFIEVSFVSSKIALEFQSNIACQNKVIKILSAKKNSLFLGILKLIYNITTDSPIFFYPQFILKILNRFNEDEKKDNCISKTLINFFRFCNVNEDEFIKFINNAFPRWLSKPEISATTVLNLEWCIYFWLRRSSQSVELFYSTFIFDFIMNQVASKDETSAKVAISICSIACNTENEDYKFRLLEYLPVQNVLFYFDFNNETANASIQTSSNFAANGPDYVQLLIDNDVYGAINYIIGNSSTQTKVETGYLITTIFHSGSREQIIPLVNEVTIGFLQELFNVDDYQLSANIISSFLNLMNMSFEISDFIDKEMISELTTSSDENVANLSQQLYECI